MRVGLRRFGLCMCLLLLAGWVQAPSNLRLNAPDPVAAAACDGDCKFVRSGGSDGNSGDDWANAYATLAMCETNTPRGDTCWIGNGAIGGMTFNTATSSGLTVTFKKATVAEHGTDTGWDAAYAAQATLGSITISTGDLVIDGSFRDEDDWQDPTAYGIIGSENATIDSINPSPCVDNVTIKYVVYGGAEGTSFTDDEPEYAIKVSCFSGTSDDWTVSYSRFHNTSHGPQLWLNGVTGFLIERNYIDHGWGKEAIRGQVSFANSIIRWNRFIDACGNSLGEGEGCTAEIAAWDSNSFDGNQICGNYFLRTRDENSQGTIVVGDNAGPGPLVSNTIVCNNTIAGVKGGNLGMYIFVYGGSGNICRNNLWYDVISSPVDPGASCNTSTNNVEVTSNPFVTYTSGSTTHDLHLTGATTAGSLTGLPDWNAEDMDGCERGADGTVDVGAFEFGC